MVSLLCPHCGKPLTRKDRSYLCENNHCFDVAKQGYVNLLLVTQKHSKAPGDNLSQVSARREFLSKGYYLPIARQLIELAAHAPHEAVLDVGCGEGWYLSQLRAALPVTEAVGLDISKDAVRYAAGADKSSLYLTATAAHMPFPAESFDLLLSLFALTLPEEFARVLKPGGSFLQVTAGPDHLRGLKEIIYPELHEKTADPDTNLPGFTLAEETLLRFPLKLDNNADILRLLSMTPHSKRITAAGMERAAAAQQLSDTAVVRFRRFTRNNNT